MLLLLSNTIKLSNDLSRTIIRTPYTGIVLGITFCIAGLAMITYLSYLGYVEENNLQNNGMDKNIRISKGQTSTTYVVGTQGSTDISNVFLSIPSKIEIRDYSYYDGMPDRIILQTLWIPMLILGSYILVHSDLTVLVKQRK